MKIQIEKASEEDIETVKRQCGTELGEVYGVAARCPNGFPQVIVLDPIRKNSKNGFSNNALSTLIWLSCPGMKKKIDELESRGMVRRVEQLLTKDRSLSSKMNDAHAQFYYFRKEMFRVIAGREFPTELSKIIDSGIGGIREIKSVKCLHLHFAHYRICSSNVVGRAVESLIREQSYCGCEESSCKR